MVSLVHSRWSADSHRNRAVHGVKLRCLGDRIQSDAAPVRLYSADRQKAQDGGAWQREKAPLVWQPGRGVPLNRSRNPFAPLRHPLRVPLPMRAFLQRPRGPRLHPGRGASAQCVLPSLTVRKLSSFIANSQSCKWESQDSEEPGTGNKDTARGSNKPEIPVCSFVLVRHCL